MSNQGFKIFDFLNKNKAEKYNKRISSLYKKVFSTPDGKEVLADLMMTGYVLESTEGDLIKEGSRKAILRIMAIVNYDATKFQNIVKKMIAPKTTEYPEDADLIDDEDEE
jgi:hypothetical protein